MEFGLPSLTRFVQGSSSRAAVATEVLAHTIGGSLRVIRSEMGLTYGFHAESSTLRGGSAVLLIEGTVENGGLTGALRTIHSELVGAERLRQADFDRGRWAVARRYNLGLETANDWVRNALAVAWCPSSVMNRRFAARLPRRGGSGCRRSRAERLRRRTDAQARSRNTRPVS